MDILDVGGGRDMTCTLECGQGSGEAPSGRKAKWESQIFARGKAVAVDAGIQALIDGTSNRTMTPEEWITLGRAYRRQNLFRESIDVFSRALALYPMHPLIYRHRAHSYLNCCCYREAVADFELSIRLDPSNFDCWYHQGVGFFLLQDYAEALETLKAGHDRCASNEDVVCLSYWHLFALLLTGKDREIGPLLAGIPQGLKLSSCQQFYRILLLFKGVLTMEELLKTKDDRNNTYLILQYGIAMYCFSRGMRDEGMKTLERLIAAEGGNRWQGFAFQAAKMELRRRSGEADNER